MHSPLYLYALGAVVVFMVGSSLWNGISQKLDAYDETLKGIKQAIMQHESIQSEWRKQQLQLDTDIQSKVNSAVNVQEANQTTLNTIQNDVEALNPQPESTPEPQASNQ